MHLILTANGITLTGLLTPDELHDMLVQILTDESYLAMSPNDRIAKLPSFMRRILGWAKKEPMLIALARSILAYLGEDILGNPEQALRTVQSNREWQSNSTSSGGFNNI
jgi:hypothetical protein